MNIANAVQSDSDSNLTIRVYVVDDDEELRDALELFLQTAGYSVVGFANAQALIDCIDDTPDCLILDVAMPEIDGLELQQLLLERNAHIPIIFLTGHGSIAKSVQAIQAGAIDFLEKPVDDKVLLERVKQAIAMAHNQRLSEQRNAEDKKRFDRLTPREKEIFRLVADGMTSKEIARILQISHRTVEAHRFRIMQKLELDSLPDMILFANAHDFVGK